MKRALIILIGLALAISAGMFVERAISRFLEPSPEALQEEDFNTPDLVTGSSSSHRSSDASNGKMIRWEDIESSLSEQSSSESALDAAVDVRVGVSSSASSVAY